MITLRQNHIEQRLYIQARDKPYSTNLDTMQPLNTLVQLVVVHTLIN